VAFVAGKAGIAYVEIKFNPGDLERMMAESKAAGREIANDTSDEINKKSSIWKSLLSNWKLLVPAIAAASIAVLGFTGNLAALAPLIPLVTAGLTAALVPFTTLAALLVGFIPPLTLIAGLLGGLGLAFGLAGKRALDGGKAFQQFSGIVKEIKKNFGELTTTLAKDFLPVLVFLARSANNALIYLNKIAHLPLKQAFESLSTTGVAGFQKFLDKVGSFLKKPITLAVGIAFGKQGGEIRNALADDWNAIVKFFTSRKIALPIETWFGQRNFSAIGYRWGSELANSIVTAMVAVIQHVWNSGRGGKMILGGAAAGAALGFYLGGPIGAAMGLAIGGGAGAVLNHYWPKIVATAHQLGADLKKAIGPDLWNSVIRDSETFWSNLKDVWGVVKKVFNALGGWKTVGAAIVIVIRVIATAVDLVLRAFNLVVGAVKDVWSAVSTIGGAVTKVYNKVSNLAGIVSGTLAGAWGGVQSAVSTLIGYLRTAYGIVLDIVNALPDNPFGGGPGAAAGRTARTGTGTGKHKTATGGIFTGPTTIGDRLFGEAGREAVLPLDSSFGRDVLAQAVSKALGGGDIYLTLDLGEGITQRLKVENKKTARTMTAGRKWATA